MKPSKITFGSKQKKPLFGNSNLIKLKYANPKNIEADAKMELNELQIAFRDKAKAEKDLQDKNTGGDYFTCIIFKDQDQRDQFFALLNITGDDLQYINGQNLIKALEMNIQHIESTTPGKFRCNREILALSLKP